MCVCVCVCVVCVRTHPHPLTHPLTHSLPPRLMATAATAALQPLQLPRERDRRLQRREERISQLEFIKLHGTTLFFQTNKVRTLLTHQGSRSPTRTPPSPTTKNSVICPTRHRWSQLYLLRTLGPKLVLKTISAPDSSRGQIGKKTKGKGPTKLGGKGKGQQCLLRTQRQSQRPPPWATT